MKGKYLSSVAGVALTSLLGVGAPAQAQSPSWTGSYFGGYAGWAWGSSHASTTVDCNVAPYTGYMCDSGSAPDNGQVNGFAVDASGTGWMHGNAFIAGLQGGYNWQIGNYVYGIESDFGSFHLRGSRQASGPYQYSYYPPTTSDTYTIGTSFNTDWLYTLRGRFGWTTEKLWREHDRMWLYLTGGLALTDLKVSFNFSDTSFSPATGDGSHSKLTPGWALGAGFEYMLDRRWSLQAEYLHLDFGNVCASGTITASGGYSQGIGTCADLTADLVRFGINYRL